MISGCEFAAISWYGVGTMKSGRLYNSKKRLIWRQRTQQLIMNFIKKLIVRDAPDICTWCFKHSLFENLHIWNVVGNDSANIPPIGTSSKKIEFLVFFEGVYQNVLVNDQGIAT